MKKEIKVWAMTCIALWWLAPNKTNAQQDSVISKVLEEVVVTATKFPKSLAETGKVLTIISEEQLSRSAGKDLAQVLNEQVGLVINGSGSNPAKDKSVFLRGASGKYTLILIDGVPVNDPSGIDGSFDMRLLSLDHIERIEILKGSQSTLYGSDAIAGVINIITKAKSEEDLNAVATAAYGSYNTFNGNAAVSGNSESVTYNASYSRYQTVGISEAKALSGNGNFDKDGFGQNAVQLNLGVSPLKNFMVKPFIRYNDFNGDYDAGAFTDDVTARYAANFLNTGFTSDFRFEKGAITFLYAYDKSNRSYKDQWGTYEYDGRFNQTESFINYDLNDYWQIIGGLSYQQFNIKDQAGAIKNPESNIFSPYTSLFLKNYKGFSLELGGRYVIHSDYGSNSTFSFNPSWFIKNSVKIFANYSTGFKAPTLTQLYGQFGANADLKPETSATIDAGVHYFINDFFNIRGTYFKRDIKNVITYSTIYFNLDELNDQGTELELSYSNRNLNLAGSYSYVQGEITERRGGNEVIKDNALFRRPQHSFGVNASYQFSNYFFLSVSFKSFGIRNDAYFDLSTFETKQLTLGAYQLLNLHAEYKFLNNKLNLFIDIRNLLDQNYFEVYGYSTQRINGMLGLRYSFK